MAANTNTAGIVIIGSEILSAKVVDQNAPYLCAQLRLLGVHTQRIITVPDGMAVIGEAVYQCAKAFKWVFTSGGIGPTHDDITIEAIAKAFGVEVLEHPDMTTRIREHYGTRVTRAHLRMAFAPAGAEVIQTPQTRFPQLRFKNIFILPGVPELFRHKFDAIKARFQSQPIALKQLYLQADEGVIAQTLQQIETEYQGVVIGSYPSFRHQDYSVRITLEGQNEAMVTQASNTLLKRLKPLTVTVVGRV